MSAASRRSPARKSAGYKPTKALMVWKDQAEIDARRKRQGAALGAELAAALAEPDPDLLALVVKAVTS